MTKPKKMSKKIDKKNMGSSNHLTSIDTSLTQDYKLVKLDVSNIKIKKNELYHFYIFKYAYFKCFYYS